MANEEDAEHVVGLALVPVGAGEETCDAGNRRGLVGVGLDSEPGVVANAKEIVDDFEALVAGGEVDGRDGADLSELGGGVVYIMSATVRTMARPIGFVLFRNEKTGMTPEGGM